MTEIKDIILEYANENDTFTIPTIAEISGYSATTVAKEVKQLKERGLIFALTQEENGKKGRRATVYGINQIPFYFIGVDVKNNELIIGLMNIKCEIVVKRTINDYRFENSHANMDLVCAKVNEFIDGLDGINRSQIAAATFNLGGRVDSRVGTSASIFNFEETRETPLADILTEAFGFPVFIENDTKAMAYGDYWAMGKRWQNVLYVNFSWGLGLGIILGGQIFNGSNGYSGEMGHISTYRNNIMCHCGKKGCMETEVSGSAIHRKLLERVHSGESSVLSGKIRRMEPISLDDIVDATEIEDPLCIELVSETAKELGRHLAGMINLFNPDCIIIGGAIIRTAPYYFIQQVSLAIRQHSLKLMSQNVVVLTSKLAADAGITGACLIAKDKAYKQITANINRISKVISVPLIEKLETMPKEKFESAMDMFGAKGEIDTINWPSLYSYSPKCSFSIARSNSFLAVSFDVTGKDLRATEMDDGGRNWEDSCCEIFLSTSEGYYYNIEINCIGSVLMAKGSGRQDREKIPSEKLKSIIRHCSLPHQVIDREGGPYHWKVSIIIPFNLIGLEQDNLPECILGNFYKCGDLTANPHFVTWSPIQSQKPDFHRPEYFGKIKF